VRARKDIEHIQHEDPDFIDWQAPVRPLPTTVERLPLEQRHDQKCAPLLVDIIIEMDYYSQPDDLDRRRRLLAFSRHAQTPRHLLIELQSDGKDYLVLQSGMEAALGESWPAVLHVLSEAHSKLTRQEILDLWPADYQKPPSVTLWRWLGRAVSQGLLRQQGAGHNNDPFRYWLPAREDMMRPDGGTPEEMEAWNNRFVTELFEKLEQSKPTKPHAETPLSVEATRMEDEDTTANPAVDASETMPMESLPMEPVLLESSPVAPGANATRLAGSSCLSQRVIQPYIASRIG